MGVTSISREDEEGTGRPEQKEAGWQARKSLGARWAGAAGGERVIRWQRGWESGLERKEWPLVEQGSPG